MSLKKLLSITILSLFAFTGIVLADSDLKINGLVYLDAYYVAATATNFVKGDKNGDFANLVDSSKKSESSGRGGFQIRRIYLTLEKNISDNISSRLRFETGNSSYKQQGDKTMLPFVKDAYLKIKHSKSLTTVWGIQAPPTLTLYEEKLWGHRAVEKVPEDLYSMRSSRDFGVSLNGDLGNLKYTLMVGNGKGSETESQTYKETKTAYLGLAYYMSESLFFELYGDIDMVPDSSLEKDTSHILIGYMTDKIRTGLQYVYQESGKGVAPNAAANFINIFSIPFVLNLSDNFSILARFDNRRKYSPSNTNGTVSDNFIIIGADSKIDKDVHIIPNVEIGTYSYEKNSPTSSSLDAVAKLTVYYKF